MKGMARPGAGAGAAGVGGTPPTPEVTFELPEGWKEKQPRNPGLTWKAFSYPGSADARDEVTISLAGGERVQNVNRWRTQQLGLPPFTEAQVAQAAKAVTVGGAAGELFDFEAARGEPKQRMLAAMVPRGDRFLFFKMTGPADAVGAQKPAFESFLRSVRFGGGKGQP
jgi:hypothetical protein